MKLRRFMLIVLAVTLSALLLLPGATKAEATGETTVVTEPTTGTAYKLQMNQVNNGTVLYFGGSTESSSVSYRLAATTDLSAAVDVYLESVAGGYHLYFMNGSTKTYIRIYERTDGSAGAGKGSLELVTSAPAEVLTWNSVYNTLVYVADSDNSYYMGTYSTYSTFSVSNTSYLKTTNVDASQFPARLATVGGSGEELPEPDFADTLVVEEPAEGEGYMLQMNQRINGTSLFFSGSTESSSVTYRLASTTDMSEAVKVYWESAPTGGYYLYFMNNGVKTYIRIYESDATNGKGSLELVTTAPAEVLHLNYGYKTPVYYADSGNTYYLGTYGSYSTFSVSNFSYLTESNVDVSQFPVRLALPGGIADGFKYTLQDGKATIIGTEQTQPTGDLIIPETVDGYPVCAIGDEAFYCYYYITSVTIPSGVTSVGEDAFFYCDDLTSVRVSSLESWLNIDFESYYSNPLGYAGALYVDDSLVTQVVIPQGTTVVGDYMFIGGVGLTSVEIPNSVTSIGKNAFAYCNKLTELTIPDSVTTIGSRAFYNCTGLTSTTIPENVIDIGYEAFAGCTGLTEIRYNATKLNDLEANSRVFASAGKKTNGVNLLIGANVQKLPAYLLEPSYSDQVYIVSVTFAEDSVCTTIGDSAFLRCQTLKTITLPDSVTDIGADAFRGCSALELITFGSNVVNIGDYAFTGCSALKNVEIPNAVTQLGSSAFSSCSALETVKLGSRLETIGSYAFSYCSALTSITIPQSVTFIGESAFEYCSSLTKVFIGEGGWATDICTNENAVHVSTLAALARISFGNYSANPLYRLRRLCVNGELVTELVIPEGVTSVGSYAFSGLDAATSVTIPASVTAIGEGAFFDCYNVESVYISNLKAWCEFEGNPLQNGYQAKLYLNGEIISGDVVIPEGTISIGNFAFYGCNQITSVTIPNSVTKIGMYAFRGCGALEAMTIGEGVRSIGDCAFQYCYGLTGTLKIPDSVTELGSEAFDSCGITGLSIGKGLYRISNGAFCNCDNLTSVVIPETVTNIENRVFSSCDGLRTVTMGSNVTKVGTAAFDASRIEKVYITDLEAWCKIDFALPSQYVGGRYSNPLGNGADLYLNGELVTEVVFPEGLTRVEAMVFEGCTSLETLIIPEGVTYIGSAAFQNCPNLALVSVPESVLYLDGSAFVGTAALDHLVYAGTQEQWDALAVSTVTTVDISHVSNVHYQTKLENKETCTGYGLYCPVCEKMLTSHAGGLGSHTYTDETDITCNVCDYVQSVEYIQVYTYPDVLQYMYQETAPEIDPLDVTGGVLLVSYNDGACLEIEMTNDMVSGLDVCQVGVQELTVTYQGKTTYYHVEVSVEFEEEEPELKPMLLLINSLPSVRSYGVGDGLNLEGLRLDAFYEDGIRIIDYYLLTVSDVDMSTPGKKRVEVEYEGLYTSFDIWVHEYTYTELDSSYYPEVYMVEDYLAVYQFIEWQADETGVGSIRVVFDENSYYDQGVYINVFDADYNFIASFGNNAAGAEVTIPGNGFNIEVFSGIDALTKGIGFESIELGKATHIYENGECFCGEGQSAVGGFVSGAVSGPSIGTGTNTQFPNLGSAWEDENAPDWIKLYEDSYDDLVLTRDLYIDLNGHAFCSQVTANGYKIYLMDSATDDYFCDDMGYMYCWDENGEPIAPEMYFKTDITGTTKQYLILEDEYEPGMYTSHRIYLNITHQTLKPSKEGIGYKAVFYGDWMVKAALNSDKAFGFTLWLGDNDPVKVYLPVDQLMSGKPVTLRIDNFDVENYGQVELSAYVMLQLADGTVIESTTRTLTLRGMLEQLNTLADSLTETQLEAVADFIKKYAIIQSWKVENLLG